MKFLSVNRDIAIEYNIESCTDKLFKWNLKNNFICNEYTKDNYFLNYSIFKIIFNYNTQKIKLLNNTYNIFIIDEIEKNINKLKKDLFNFRFQKVNSQVTNPSKIGETKKTIARLKTTLKEKINV